MRAEANARAERTPSLRPLVLQKSQAKCEETVQNLLWKRVIIFQDQAMSDIRVLTSSEVSAHASRESCWVIVHGELDARALSLPASL